MASRPAPTSPGALSLALKPLSGLCAACGRDRWLAVSSPIRFELDPGGGRLPGGWVLLTGTLSRTILDGSAQLVVEAQGREHAIPVPVSRAGTVLEVVELPAGARRMVWQPSGAKGPFRHAPLAMRPLGFFARAWYMLFRVVWQLCAQPRARRRAAGLTWWGALASPHAAYLACGRLRAHGHAPQYPEWIARHDTLDAGDRARIRRRIERLRAAPRFAVLVLGERGASDTRRSLEAQLYRGFSVHQASFDTLPPEADYVVVLDSGDLLAEHALYWFAETIARSRDAALVYADDDRIDAHGTRCDARFKPDWSPEHLRSIDYIGRGGALRRAEFEAAGGVSLLEGGSHALNLRVCARLRPGQVAHVPAVLLHRAAWRPEPAPARPPRHPLPAPLPPLSIVVPTRDAEPLLRRCVHSVLGKSTYRGYELLLVDNGSSDPAALALLAELQARPGVRVLRDPRPFNFAALCNRAVREAAGDVVVLLNNDTELITADWLEQMLALLAQPGVGAVGAKLLFPDGTVQHGGDAVGPGGLADHFHIGLPADAPGYCARAIVAQEVSAVTAACLMTWKHLYLEAGGFDERRLPVAFNDVDYCLRLGRRGLRVIYTPLARLVHHESATRGGSQSAAERRRAGSEVLTMRLRWARRLRHDPYYNPNLGYDQPDFSLADAPRVRRPWR